MRSDCACFNVAAADQPRKVISCTIEWLRIMRLTASMWPRLISRGRCSRRSPASAEQRFNVAAADQPRKGPSQPADAFDKLRGFNVAAADQPRKADARL